MYSFQYGHFVEVGSAFFGFGPKQRGFGSHRGIAMVNTHAKVHIADDAGAVVSPKIFGSHLVFQFFFANVGVFHRG